MNAMRRPSTVLAELTVLVVFTATAAPVHAQELRGDSAAVAMARTMIDRMGGRAVWSAATAMRIVEDVHPASARAPHRSDGWRGLTEPELWWRTRTPEGERIIARSASGGWERRDATVTPSTNAGRRRWRGYWPRNIYVMYGRLAREDSLLQLARDGERGFAVLDAASGELLGRFEVTAGGELYRWSASFGLDSESWIYAPLIDFGPIRMPAWGVRVDDGYRFFYREVVLSPGRIPVSLELPRP
jgi:hypothetical protein